MSVRDYLEMRWEQMAQRFPYPGTIEDFLEFLGAADMENLMDNFVYLEELTGVAGELTACGRSRCATMSRDTSPATILSMILTNLRRLKLRAGDGAGSDDHRSLFLVATVWPGNYRKALKKALK
jgi:hypothetical protein